MLLPLILLVPKWVVYNMGVLKSFVPGTYFGLWVSRYFTHCDIFWSGEIEAFCSLGHILIWRYSNILPTRTHFGMEVLKHFSHWDIFWSGYVETFYPLGYWNILPPGVLKYFEPRIYKDFELYQVFMYNFLY